MKYLTKELVLKFKKYLINEEKAISTIEKYIRDILRFMVWMNGQEVEKTHVLEYKQALLETYAPASVNSILSSLNAFFDYYEWFDCRVKTLKIQRQIFSSSDKELTKEEYKRLLSAARQKKNQRLFFMMQTICATGIRVSEDI